MWNSLVRIWSLPDLRKNILFVLAMLVAFRFAANIPLPGVDINNLKAFLDSNQIFGLLNVFSGGGLGNFSVVAMGVGPYITASIILQLLVMIVPSLEKLSKEGEYGRQKINQYTRYLTVPLAMIQSYSLVMLLKNSPKPILGALDPWTMGLLILSLTAGTLFLMWIGELISERKIGNGISLLIFAGIVSRLPVMVQSSLSVYDSSQLFSYLGFIAVGIFTIVTVVVMTEAQRNIPVTYARQTRGDRMTGSMHSHLPLRLNQAGVIPIIFAISIILFPPTLAQFFLQARTPQVAQAAQAIITFFNNQTVYGVLYFFLVVGFTYFYTAIIFKPEQVAENLQKQGGFIPGIRPGKATEEFLQMTVNRIILPGALFLAIIAVLPLIMRQATGMTSLAVGGTSLLIVVSVVLETLKQIDAQLTMRDYEHLI